jgi:hypothetical protein
MTPEVFAECKRQKTRERVEQLNALRKRWTNEGRQE